MVPIRLQWHDIYSGRTYLKRGWEDLQTWWPSHPYAGFDEDAAVKNDEKMRIRKICDKFDVWHHPYSKSTFTCSNCWTSNSSSTNGRIWFGKCVKDWSSLSHKTKIIPVHLYPCKYSVLFLLIRPFSFGTNFRHNTGCAKNLIDQN